MADDYVRIPADSTGKKLQTHKNTVGANVVHAEATVPVHTDGTALTTATGVKAKLAANSGVDVGDVDVTSVVPGTAATNLGKAEDALHTTGDTGVMMLGVRNDTPTSMVNVDLDYTPIAVDEYGRLKTAPDGTTPVIYNVTMTNADTEYSQALPNNCKKFLIHTRDETEFRLAFVTGKVATPTAPWVTIPAGARYNEDNIGPSTLTLYFASDSAGKIIEIIAWS